MLTNDQLRRLLEELPERGPRSRLHPYGDLIAEMRHRNYSYREIARFLAERCGFQITHNAVRNYVKQYCLESRGPQPSPKSAGQQALPAVAAPTKSEESRSSREEMDEVRQRIATLKTRRHSGTPDEPSFGFDPTQPLRLTYKD
jgi:hypothetical protein